MKRFSSVLLVGALLVGAARGAEYKFIVHPGTAVAALSREEAKSMLLGNQGRWDNGTAIKLAILAGGPVHESVITEITARTPDQFDKYWKKQVFTGKGVMPEIMPDDAAMVAYVARTPGAFGYVSAAAKTEGVKVVPVQ